MFSVYGEGLRKQLLWDCGVKLMAAADPIELGGSGEELRDWIHIDDAVAMLRRIAGMAGVDCPIFNGGSGVAAKVRDIVALLSSRGGPSRWIHGIAGAIPPYWWRIPRASGRRASPPGPLNLGVQRYADGSSVRNE
jgi:UDP-glucose 4-epimerase